MRVAISKYLGFIMSDDRSAMSQGALSVALDSIVTELKEVTPEKVEDVDTEKVIDVDLEKIADKLVDTLVSHKKKGDRVEALRPFIDLVVMNAVMNIIAMARMRPPPAPMSGTPTTEYKQ